MQSVKALRRWLVIVALLRLLAGIGVVYRTLASAAITALDC